MFFLLCSSTFLIKKKRCVLIFVPVSCDEKLRLLFCCSTFWESRVSCAYISRWQNRSKYYHIPASILFMECGSDKTTFIPKLLWIHRSNNLWKAEWQLQHLEHAVIQISRKSVSVSKQTELGLLKALSVMLTSQPLGSCELLGVQMTAWVWMLFSQFLYCTVLLVYIWCM